MSQRRIDFKQSRQTTMDGPGLGGTCLSGSPQSAECRISLAFLFLGLTLWDGRRGLTINLDRVLDRGAGRRGAFAQLAP